MPENVFVPESKVAEVQRKFLLAQENQAQDFTRLRELRQTYRGVRDPSLFNIPTRAQYVVPTAFKIIETAIPRIISVLFSTSPPISTKWRVPRESGEEDLKLRILDHLFEWHYDTNSTQSLYWKVYGWLKDALIYGQSYIKVGWRHKSRKYVEDLDPSGILGMDTKTERTEVLEDRADVMNPSIFNLYFAPDAVGPDIIGSASWLIEHSRKPRSKVLAQRGGLYLDFDENALMGGRSDDDTAGQLASDLDNHAEPTDDYHDPMIDIYEYWTDDRLIVTANHTVKLRDEENPFGLPTKPKRKPYVAAIDYLIINELWQIGEVEMVKDIQKEITTLRRMRTDVNNLIINPMWLINNNADINESELGLSRPGGFVHATPQDGKLDNAIRPVPMGAATGLSSEEHAFLNKDADEVSGQHDYTVGAAPARRETATTVQLLQAAANMRFDIKVRGFSHSFMEFNWMLFERLKQFLTKQIPLRIPRKTAVGFNYVRINRDDLPDYDDVDLVAQGDPASLMKDARKQEIAQLYEIINNSPYVMPQTKLKMMAIVAKSREIEGIDSVLQELDIAAQQIPQTPSMNLEQGAGPTGTPPVPPSGMPEMSMPPDVPMPEGAPAGAQMLPFPRQQR